MESGTSAALPIPETETDLRIVKLQSFLRRYNSPFAAYAGEFVSNADKYGLEDWTLVPAITGVESTFGKSIPADSYNAYGWANGNFAFNNWPESIAVVTKTLKEKYIDRDLKTVDQIAAVYAPPSQTWAGKVNYFKNLINDYYIRNSSELSITL